MPSEAAGVAGRVLGNWSTTIREVGMFCACGGVMYPNGTNVWRMRNQRRHEPAQL